MNWLPMAATVAVLVMVGGWVEMVVTEDEVYWTVEGCGCDADVGVGGTAVVGFCADLTAA